MKKFFLVVLFLLISFNNSFSQLANQGTILLKNLDTYPSYSACWGYIAPNGREYAILGTNVGTSFVDITDSANIREVDSVKGHTSTWREMKTYSHYAYVVTEATSTSNPASNGLQIIDLQYLPDSVSLVRTWNYPGYTKTHSISQSGPYLYLNGGNSAANGGVTVVDVSDPVNPVKLGQWTTLYVHDSRILNDTIWASNVYTGETSIINATNKSSLEFIRTWRSYPQSTISTHNCAFSRNNKYLFTTNEVFASPNGKLSVWNVEDINNITYISDWMPTNITTSVVHNVETYGDFAVIAHYSAGIRIVNITDPLNPVEVAWYDTYPANNNANFSGCWGVYKFPSGKIIGSDISNGLYVIKTTFPLTGIINNVNVITKDFRLDQNYPNPFNPSTTIKFSLKENSYVDLKVFDMQGREVAEVVNDRRDGGNYEIAFDANNFKMSSGTYFYKLNVQNLNKSFTETKKMILIK